MLDQKSDLELIEEFKSGLESSFEELIKRYSEKAYNLAMRLTRNQEDAEEVLQDVFVTVFRKVGGFQGKSSFSSWFYRVTMNAALMKLRKNKQTQVVALDDVLPQINLKISENAGSTSDLDRLALRNELVSILQESIGKLPEDYRPVFVLRDVDGLTSREVGRMLNLSIPAVKSRLHRSRLMLRRRLMGFFKEYQGGLADTTRKAGNSE